MTTAFYVRIGSISSEYQRAFLNWPCPSRTCVILLSLCSSRLMMPIAALSHGEKCTWNPESGIEEPFHLSAAIFPPPQITTYHRVMVVMGDTCIDVKKEGRLLLLQPLAIRHSGSDVWWEKSLILNLLQLRLCYFYLCVYCSFRTFANGSFLCFYCHQIQSKERGEERNAREGCKLHIMWHYMPMHIQRIPIEGSCQKLSALLIKSKLSCSPNVFGWLLPPQSFQLIWMSSTSCNILRMHHAWTLKYFFVSKKRLLWWRYFLLHFSLLPPFQSLLFSIVIHQ